MSRTALLAEYEGTDFVGFQWQPDGPTVQGAVEAAVEKIYGEKIRITGSGRTDSGVHARGQVMHFDSGRVLPEVNTVRALNTKLPASVRILAAAAVDEEFHARFSAVRRHYSYHIILRNTALERNFTWYLPAFRSSDRLRGYAGIFSGKHDFTSFCSTQAEVKHKFCNVIESTWEIGRDHLIYRISADRFLHSMVRSLVGTMIYFAGHDRPEGDLEKLLQDRQRGPECVTAPPGGLFLEAVDYETEIPWIEV